MNAPAPSRRLLLVEDNPGDVALVREFLEGGDGAQYEILTAGRLAEAIARLKQGPVDVVLVDPTLPDGQGEATVRAIRAVIRDTPILVLTGADQEQLWRSCLDAGAQDYLTKGEIHGRALRRAVEFAIARYKEARLREQRETLAQYRTLSSRTQPTQITAALAGTGAIAHRYPKEFRALVEDYAHILECSLDRVAFGRDVPRLTMERLVTRLGDLGGGPRDLIDVHVEGFDACIGNRTDERSRALVVEGRLLALEMMGLLVDYYRVGLRRSHEPGEPL